MTAPRPTTIVCDVGTLGEPHAGTIDALARLQLAARRHGFEIRLRHASNELHGLLSFAGLSEVLRLEPIRQAEERKQRLGVEEERELDDPSA
jgi:STAS domain